MSEGFLLVDYNMQVLSFNQSAVKFLFGGEKVQSHLKKSSCEPKVVKSVENALAGKTVFVHGVYQFLREMVFNLCDNAVKYNKIGGSVKVNVETFPNGLPFIKVSDTGIGIPISHQSRVFERFYRVDKSHSKEIGGTGLGLSIVKHSAAYHGATITLKSEVDVGTEITVTFKTE